LLALVPNQYTQALATFRLALEAAPSSSAGIADDLAVFDESDYLQF
jgi:hypothetical protein